jgi:hypothetical protein
MATAMAAATARIAAETLDPRDEVFAESDEKYGDLERQVFEMARHSTDAVADTRTLKVRAIPRDELAPEIESVRIEVNGDGPRIAISEMAHNQLAEKLGIPKPYYRRMLASQPELLAENLNTWLTREPNKNLLRLIGGHDAAAQQQLTRTDSWYILRAFLGASYRPLDNAELLTTVLPLMKEHGAALRDFNLTEQRLHARFIIAEREITSVKVNEVVRVGAYLRNSETGFATLDVAGFMEILKCMNGMIVPAQVNVRHVGSRKGASEEEGLAFLSTQTQRLDNAAIFSRVRDALVETLSEERQLKQIAAVIAAKESVIRIDEPTFEFVGRVGARLDLTDAEQSVLNEEVVRAQIDEGGLTRFALTQGVTALARRSDSFDRRTELERAGWTILTSDTSKLLAAGRVAAKRKN